MLNFLTDVDKSLEDQALESSTAVSNLLGYATATSQSTVQGSHDIKPVVTTESQVNSEQATAQKMQRYSSEVEKVAVKTEDIQGQSISAKVESLKAIPGNLCYITDKYIHNQIEMQLLNP
jgi:phosphoenolpyruvate carboxylase